MTVTSADQRRTLAVQVAGAPCGVPVFLLHGTPGSRLGPQPRSITLERLGVKLISYDRPGYGRSTRDAGRNVASAAQDIAAIADGLGVNRFAVVGRSGGGPHALACAARLRRRVTRAAVLVSLAPSDARELDWYEGMGDGNVAEYSTADADQHLLFANMRVSAERTQEDPESFIRSLEKEESLTSSDRRVVEDVALRRLLTATYAEAMRQGADGWIDDVLAFRRPWGVDLSKITAQTKLWHGADDAFSPPHHSRWLSARIRGVEIEEQPGIGHFGAVEVLPRMLSWVVSGVGQRAAVAVATGKVPAGMSASSRTGHSGQSVDTRSGGAASV